MDHSRVDDVEAVVEHGDDEAHNKRGRELAAVVPGEDARGREGLLQWCKRLPESESDETAEAGAEGSDDTRAVRGEGGGVDDAHENERRGEDEENSADVVKFPEGLIRRQATRVFGRVVIKIQTDKGDDYRDGWGIEEPSPLTSLAIAPNLGCVDDILTTSPSCIAKRPAMGPMMTLTYTPCVMISARLL